MSLNIKNPRTTALVRELAERTGTSQTEAVEVAVRERLAALDAGDSNESGSLEERVKASERLVERIRANLTPSERHALRTAESELYDESGLPA